jgi:hypothetical protein
LLLLLFMFNWFGYRLLSDYMQYQADTKLEAQLDRDQYDASRLIEMRVPLNMPYQLNSTDFERYDGEIEIDGIHYKYVKRKVEDGQLVLLCLPNDSKTQLQNASNDFFKLVNDLQTGKHNHQEHSIKNPITEYWQQVNHWAIERPVSTTNLFAIYTDQLPSFPSITTPAQPPEC